MPTITADCLRLRRIIHGDLCIFAPADWTSRVSGASLLFTIPNEEGKGLVQVVVHRDCTHRGEGAAILRELESFIRDRSMILANRRGPQWLPAAAGGDRVYGYEWDMQQGGTAGRLRALFVEIAGVGLAELMAVGNGRLMGELDATLDQIAHSICHRKLEVGLNEPQAVREWRARLGGRVLERVAGFFQSMNGGTTSSEQYTFSSDGTYRHTLLRSASFHRLGGLSSQSEENGRWRVVAVEDGTPCLTLDSYRGGYRKLRLNSASDGILLDRVRYAVR